MKKIEKFVMSTIKFLIVILLVVQATSAVEIDCKFGTPVSVFPVGNNYFCFVKTNPNIIEPNTTVTKANGNHNSGKNDASVQGFHSQNSNNVFHYIPHGIGEVFPNLVYIGISYGRIKEIHADDLKQFPKLRRLDLHHNDIEIIEKDLFKFNPDLAWIWLSDNKIKEIHPNVFDNLNKLNDLAMWRNKCVDNDAYKYRARVLNLIEEIKINCAPATESTTEPAIELATESTTEPAIELTTESTTEPAIELATESTTEPAIELATESTTEPAIELATESTTEPAIELATESTTEPAIAPTIESTTEPAIAPATVFTNIGTNHAVDKSGRNYTKTFFVPKFLRARWHDALLLCKHFNLELATIESNDELNKLIEFLRTNNIPLDKWLHVGGVAATGGSTWDWRWIHDDSHVYSDMKWVHGEPNNINNGQWCLAIGDMFERSYNDIGYADVSCHSNYFENDRFLCQKKSF